MKKIFNLLIVLTIAVVYTACTSEVDDVFDKSSSKRIEEALSNDKAILTSATNGWLMEYYGNTTYGGYNMFVKFNEDNTATVSNELYGAGKTQTSHYKLEQSQGVVLSFDEYNEIFHIFSEPDASKSGVGTNGKGFEGDLEFRIKSASKDSIILEGKKHASIVKMTPVVAEQNWDTYYSRIETVQNSYSFSRYGIVIGQDTLVATTNYRRFDINAVVDGEEVVVKAPYIVTAEGLKFYKPITLNGKTITGISYVENLEEGNEKWPAMNDASVTVVAMVPPINEQFVNGEWFIAYSNLGPYAKGYWNYVKSGEEAIGEELYYAYFGTDTDNKWGLIFASLAGTSLYGGRLYFDYQLAGDDAIVMYFNKTGGGDGVWYYSNARFNYAVFPFGYNASSARTFRITTDDLNNPSYVILTDQAQPNNIIKLVSNVVYRPFDN